MVEAVQKRPGADGSLARPATTETRAMQLIDWLIMIVPLMVVAIVALRTHRYTQGVADFMSGSRCAGR